MSSRERISPGPLALIMSPIKGDGEHIGLSADPGRRRPKYVSTIVFNSFGGILPNLHEYILGTSQRANKILVTDLIFKVTQEALGSQIFCVGVFVTISCMNDIS